MVAAGLFFLVSDAVRASWAAMALALVVLVLSRPARLTRVAQGAIWATAVALVFAWLIFPNVAGTLIGKSLTGLSPGRQSTEAANSEWRLEYWSYELSAVARDPLGKGFGPGSNFCSSVSGQCEDTRLTRAKSDVTGPHNSFVNITYRAGVQGILVLLALLGAIVAPAWRVMRRTGDSEIRRTMVLLAFVAGTACFSVALENPYMGLPFWILLGLLVVLTRSATATNEPETREV